jgi:tetratricopeptide (TPR) repeat protein
MRAPDRDQQNSYKAELAIKKMLEQFPDSDYVPIAKQYLNEVQESLALSDFGVGQFYADRGNFLGAKSRFREIADKYPNYSAMDDAYYRLAQSLEKTQNPDEAAIYYGKIASAYPFSKHFDDAKERLKDLGKPIPAVDTQLAALNESRLKPSEGFSPLRPFISFAEALGFKGPPDRYVYAKKVVEEKKAGEAAVAQANVPAEGAKAGDDILITTTISKDASGKTQDNTVLGANATPAGADKSGDNKKNSGKKSKKNKKTNNSSNEAKDNTTKNP